MFPIEIPVGTTLESLFTEVVPELHRRFSQSPPASREEITAVVRVVDSNDRANDVSYTFRILGDEIRVTEGEAAKVPIWMCVERVTVERFLADWTGPKRYLPRSLPKSGLVPLSDPRVLRRIVMVSGRVELALVDFEGGRISMCVGCGDAAKKGIDTADPDVVIEAKTLTFEKILQGALAPEEALVDGDVVQRGKRFVALQLALAIAPFYPRKP